MPFDEARLMKEYPELNTRYAMTTNPETPLIMVGFDDGWRIIDGWHRLYKAMKLGWKDVPVVLIPAEVAVLFRLAKVPPGHPTVAEACERAGLGHLFLT
jgi:hypothetical protein